MQTNLHRYLRRRLYQCPTVANLLQLQTHHNRLRRVLLLLLIVVWWLVSRLNNSLSFLPHLVIMKKLN
jgi:hypothetical protein